MIVTAESYGHAVILNTKGELTEDTLAAFEKSIERYLQDKEVIDVVLNLEEVPFLDSKALEFLLDLQDRLAQKLGQVKLLRCDENVQKILEVTRLASAFETYKDIPEAVKAIQA